MNEGNKAGIDKLAQTISNNMYFPEKTQEWINALRSLNSQATRRLLKKTRTTLPKKYRRLWKAPDEKIEILMHYMRTKYPMFSAEEKKLSANFIFLKNRIANGFDPMKDKLH